MSWSNLIATGSGELELRLEIEGWGYEFVTSSAMAQTLGDGRVRLDGMSRAGIVLRETVDLPSAEIDASAFTVSVVDHQEDDAVTRALYRAPDQITYLTSNALSGSTATFVGVTSTAGFPDSGVIHIGTEAIAYTAKNATSFTGVTRAYWGTIKQSHYAVGLDDEVEVRQEVTNVPRTIEGRRANLYAYGSADDLTGDGTLIWRGVCLSSPKLGDDHATWSFQVDPITTLLERDLGGEDEGECSLRGVHYADSIPFEFFAEEDGARFGVAISGFFETQEAWCDHVTTELAAAWPGGWVSTPPVAVPFSRADGRRTWALRWTHPAGVTLRLLGWRKVPEGVDQGGEWFTEVRRGDGSLFWSPSVDTGYGWGDLSSGESYLLTSRIGGGVPRAVLSPNAVELEAPLASPQNVSARAAYLSGGFLVSRQDAGVWDSEPVTFQLAVASTRTVYLTGDSVARVARSYDEVDGTLPEIKLLPRLTPAPTGDLADVRDHLVAQSIQLANVGAMPLITTSDVADWSDVVEAAAGGRPALLARRYVMGSSATLGEVLAEECKLLGVYPALDTDGKITLRELRLPAATEAVSATVDEDTILVDDGLPTIEVAARNGYIGTVAITLGYDPVEDDHRGPKYVNVSARSVSARKAQRTLKIEPISNAASETALTVSDAVFIASKVTSLYGREYAVVEVEVPFVHFGIRIGDTVRIKYPSLPTPQGTRGLDAAATVIERAWQLDDASGRLSLLVSFASVAGYTATVGVTGASGSGTAWTFDVATTLPGTSVDLMPAGQDIEDHFAVGDRVYVSEWADGSPTRAVGTVASVSASGGTIGVTFDASFSGLGSSQWVIDFAEAGEATARQRRYAYVADASDRVAFAVPLPARTFA